MRSAIVADGLFDGVRWRPGRHTIVIDGARIHSVLAGSPDCAVDRTVCGGFVAPGLVDTHSHLVLDPQQGLATSFAGTTRDVLLEQVRERARSALLSGVTTIRDLGDFDYLAVALRDDLAAAGDPGPRILAAGPPITVAGGHCSFLGACAENGVELVEQVHTHADCGVDVIKIMASGGMGDDPARPYYDAASLRTAVVAAADRGLSVTVHAHSLQAIGDAVAAGVAGIEHCTFMTATGIAEKPDVITDIARNGIFVGATVARPQPHMPESVVATLGAYWANHRYMMQAQGIPVVLCSDAGINPAKPHTVLARDLEWVADQVGAESALAAATSTAARACGLEGQICQIAAGYRADLLLLDKDPTQDISTITRPAAVFYGGREVTSQSLPSSVS